MRKVLIGWTRVKSMSVSYAVVPMPGSYVNEWVALWYGGPEDFGSVKRILKGTPWVAQLDLSIGSAVVTRVHPAGVEQWTLEIGSWLVKSPHDKVWIMDGPEFVANFREAS